MPLSRFDSLRERIWRTASRFVLKNAKLFTLEPDRPQAQALAARSGKIVAIKTNQEVQPYVGASTKVVDLAGRHLAAWRGLG